MYRLFLTWLFWLGVGILFGQPPGTTKIFTSDIDNFWIAYDSVHKSNDSTIQKQIIQTLYLDNATKGLKNFMFLRQHSAGRHLKNIQKYPRFWVSVRPHTLAIETHRGEMETIMDRFRKMYADFKQPEIYFTIGCLNSGGTTQRDRVLIGSEIAASDSTVDASELGTWLQRVFKDQTSIVYLVAHETVHTQQKGTNTSANLLTSCLAEGSADFIAELLLQKPFSSPYMKYGYANEKDLWLKFEKGMYGTDIKDWLYNGGNVAHADLGYFMGYVICKSYYDQFPDKQKVVSDILALKYGNKKMIEDFFLESKYSEKWK